ncbi:TPA: hypothetical protein U1383_002148 [Streptococcus suis]|nr:hypothetical protein [Streptococcus suis]
MADDTKRKDIDSTADELAEAISFLYSIYKSIISKRLPKVHRKVKVYPTFSLPAYHRTVKVYEELIVPDEHELVSIPELPDKYYPTPTTEVRHVIDKERYEATYQRVLVEVKKRVKNNATYYELNNLEELIDSMERSPFTELYEEYFDEDDISLSLSIFGEIMDKLQLQTLEYRQERAFGAF